MLLLKAFSCHSWFLEPLTSEMERGTLISRAPYSSLLCETSFLPLQWTRSPSPRVLAVSLPSFGRLILCSLLSSVFYDLTQFFIVMSYVLSEMSFMFWRKHNEKETSRLVRMERVRLVYDGSEKIAQGGTSAGWSNCQKWSFVVCCFVLVVFFFSLFLFFFSFSFLSAANPEMIQVDYIHVLWCVIWQINVWLFLVRSGQLWLYLATAKSWKAPRVEIHQPVW